MKRIIIAGPNKLKGSVSVQGAKNAAMKHVIMPLLTNDIFRINNVPRIGSIDSLLEILKQQGTEYEWEDNNSISINTRDVKRSAKIPAKKFYYTSNAIHLVPILTSRFGKCIIEKEKGREDYGGDQIGTRIMKHVISTLLECGIVCKETDSDYIFKLESDKPFVYDVPNLSFGATVNAVFSATFKKGTSRITNYTTEPEFDDIYRFLEKMGVGIQKTKKEIIIKGSENLKGITFTTMGDRNDFATWVSAALMTNSKITINNVNYETMKLDPLDEVSDKMKFTLEYGENFCKVIPNTLNLKPSTLKAGRYPMFQTEWQVLFSPVFTQIKGKSRIFEHIYANRMSHWKELKKMGAKYRFVKGPKLPYVGKNEKVQNGVEVSGQIKLKGAKVKARDVRCGAALIVAGLKAQGRTEIIRIEHIERGYEDIVGRLKKLGVDINEK